MDKNATTPNSQNESKNTGIDQEITSAMRQAKMAQHIFKNHIAELEVRRDIYADQPKRLDIGQLQYEALLAELMAFDDKHDFYGSAMELDGLVQMLLRTIAVKELDPESKLRYAGYIEQLLSLQKMYLFLFEHIMPYAHE